MTSHSPASSPELPDLPLQGLSSWLHHMAYKFPADAPTLIAWAKEATAIAAIPLYCRDSHEASLKYVKGYEAGSAAAAQAAWRPIAEAPRDGTPILGLCNHEADPYYVEDEAGGGVGCLTDYGARVEGLSHVEDGAHVLVWGESYEVSDGWENPSFMMPGGWELSHDCEVMANPTHWMPLPAAPTGEQA